MQILCPFFVIFVHFLSKHHTLAFNPVRTKATTYSSSRLSSQLEKTFKEENSKVSNVEEYRNAVTKILSNFMNKDSMAMSAVDPLSDIDFCAPKIPPTTSLETLASALDYELIEKEWFVTGKVNPSYFSDDFEFQDPDVQLKGIEEYARGVFRLFDQKTSRAEIISTVVNATTSTPQKPVITCTWRLSGNVNFGFGLPIKPYIVYTDFVVDPKTSLVTFQEDQFDLPPWDILLSALFPALIGKVTAPPAPPVAKRVVPKPNLSALSPLSTVFQPLEALSNFFNQLPGKT